MDNCLTLTSPPIIYLDFLGIENFFLAAFNRRLKGKRRKAEHKNILVFVGEV